MSLKPHLFFCFPQYPFSYDFLFLFPVPVDPPTLQLFLLTLAEITTCDKDYMTGGLQRRLDS